MKIAVTGKGGVGKTTISALLLKAFKEAGYNVLGVDADPNSYLPRALGVPESFEIRPLSMEKDLIKERVGEKGSPFFRLNPKVDDLIDRLGIVYDGIRIMVMGGIEGGGMGCACPENSLIKSLISHLILERDEMVLVDMVAGIEPLGRGTVEGVNLFLIVVEPDIQSILTARRIRDLASEIGIDAIYAVVNKLRDESERIFIEKNLGPVRILSFLPYDPLMVKAQKEGGIRLPDSSPLLQGIRELSKIIGTL